VETPFGYHLTYTPKGVSTSWLGAFCTLPLIRPRA
jgi:hypothetical protein